MSMSRPPIREAAELDQTAAVAIQELATRLGHALQANRRTCVHCVWFSVDQGEVCTKATPVMRPPAKVIAFGCQAFEVMDIPF